MLILVGGELSLQYFLPQFFIIFWAEFNISQNFTD